MLILPEFKGQEVDWAHVAITWESAVSTIESLFSRLRIATCLQQNLSLMRQPHRGHLDGFSLAVCQLQRSRLRPIHESHPAKFLISRVDRRIG